MNEPNTYIDKIGQAVRYYTCSGWLFGQISNLWTELPSGIAYARVFWEPVSAKRDGGTYADLPVYRLERAESEGAA